MNESTAADLRKLADLRASGAITVDQYDRLVAPVLDRARQEQSPQTVSASTTGNAPGSGPSMLRVAAAAGAGAIAGTLAADLIQNAFTDPPPEVLEATINATTTYTADGYVTEADIVWEDSSGDVVAEGTYVEEAGWQDEGTSGAPDTYYEDAGADFGGFDF